MNMLERIKTDKLAIGTCVALVLSIVARILQVVVLKLTTDYFPLNQDNLITVLMGLAPSVLLLVYVLCFYKTDMPQLLLPIVFLFQLGVALWSAWVDFQIGMMPSTTVVSTNLIWVVYYAFLFFVTYKGFEKVLIIKIVTAVMGVYSTIGSLVTWFTLVRMFGEETEMIVSQGIAIIGYTCYYVATFLIVPKAVEGNGDVSNR